MQPEQASCLKPCAYIRNSCTDGFVKLYVCCLVLSIRIKHTGVTMQKSANSAKLKKHFMRSSTSLKLHMTAGYPHCTYEGHVVTATQRPAIPVAVLCSFTPPLSRITARQPYMLRVRCLGCGHSMERKETRLCASTKHNGSTEKGAPNRHP
jgi:hypothetical protein